MILERIYLALQQPATWYAIATGAGVFGVPVGLAVAWWQRRRCECRSALIDCAEEWESESLGFKDWIGHAKARHRRRMDR